MALAPSTTSPNPRMWVECVVAGSCPCSEIHRFPLIRIGSVTHKNLSRGFLRACRRLVGKQITFCFYFFFRRITCPLCQSGIQRGIKGNRDLDLSELPRNLKKMDSLLQATILRLMMHQLDSMVLGTEKRATGCVN